MILNNRVIRPIDPIKTDMMKAMKTAIILHGMPSKKGYYDPNRESQSNDHWLPWLQHELLLRDILAQTPELPRPYEPVHDDWKREFERYDLNAETMLIGHSCGGGFIIRYLSENNDIKVGKVVLVAPWLDPEGELNTGMFNFEMNERLIEQVESLTIFNSDDDDKDIQDSVSQIRKKVPGIKYREFHGYGHFVYRDMRSREFPDLLTELTGE